jgi:hypothetical protein
MEAIRSSETSVNARFTQRHIPEDDILHSHGCESLKSYNYISNFSEYWLFYSIVQKYRSPFAGTIIPIQGTEALY